MRTAPFVASKTVVRVVAVALVLGAGLAGTAVAQDEEPIEISGLKPASPQPDAGALQPGLYVEYLTGFKYNHIDEMRSIAQYQKTSPGEPIPMLNYRVGQGKVLTSRYENLVGAFIDGFLKFPEPGEYTIWVHSNDGVEFNLSEEMVYTLPDVHPDTMSEPIIITIDEAGWYPLNILYFEKKNTSTLEFYWQPPGATEKDFIPAEFYAHLPKS